MEEGNEPVRLASFKAWAASLFFLLLFDCIFIGPALFTDDQRAAWDPMFMRQPLSSENPDHKEAEKSALRTDWSRQFAPWSRIVRDSWKEGRPPLWDQYSALGKPLAGNVQCEAFSPYLPINLLAGWQYWDFKQLAVLFLSQIFCLLLARALGFSALASVLCALAFSFCSYIQCWIMHPHSGVAAFYPGLAWAFLKLKRHASLRALGVSSLVLAMSNLAGHVETTALIGVGAAALVFFLPERGFFIGRLKFFFWVMAAVALAAVLSSVMLVPFFDYLSDSNLVASRQELRSTAAIHAIKDWHHLLTIFDPDIIGHHLSGYRGEVSFIETGFFLGSGVLMLSVFGLLSGLRRHLGLVVACCLTMTLAVICAYSVEWMQAILARLPGFGEMPLRRFVFVAAMPMALLAGLGMDQLRKIHSRIAAFGFFLVATGVVAVPIIFEQCCGETPLAPAMPQESLPWLIVPGLLMVSILCFDTTGKRKDIMLMGLVVLVGLEAQFRWRHDIPTQPASLSPPQSAAMSSLKKCSKTGRVLPLLWSIVPEQHAVYGVKTVKAYDAILTERFSNLILKSGAFYKCRTLQATAGANKGMMDMMSVRWLLSTVPQDRILRPASRRRLDPENPYIIEIELEPRGRADFMVGTVGRSPKIKGLTVTVESGDQKIVRKNVESGKKYRENLPRFGFLHSNSTAGMRFSKIALPRCSWPETVQFESRAASKQKFRFTFELEEGKGLCFQYLPEPASEMRFYEKHAGTNIILERPSALPYAYLAPKVEKSDEPDKILEWICSEQFNPHAHTALETAGDERFSFNEKVLPAPVPVEISRPYAERFDLKTDTDAEQLLVINEAYAPGWRAFIDDREVPIYRANYVMMGIPVHKGVHHIRLEYAPRYFNVAVYSALAALALCVGFLFVRPRPHTGLVQDPESVDQNESAE